jgi:hypothetical protein
MEGWSVGILRRVVFLPSSVRHRVGLSAVVRSEDYARWDRFGRRRKERCIPRGSSTAHRPLENVVALAIRIDATPGVVLPKTIHHPPGGVAVLL